MSEFHYVRTTGVDGGVDACDGPAIGVDLESVLKNDYQPGMPAGDAARLGRRALNAGAERSSELGAASLEVCLLDRSRTGRKFCRLSTDEVQGMLDS